MLSKFKKDNPWFDTKAGQISLKVIIIGLLIILMNIPLGFVNEVIQERGKYQEDATSSIEQSWGKEQRIAPLILSVPFKESYFTTETEKETQIIDKKEVILEKKIKVRKEVNRFAQILPKSLIANVSIAPEEKQRGIFKKVVYIATINLKGQFQFPNLEDLQKLHVDKFEKAELNNAAFNLGISDLKGVMNNPPLQIGDQTLDFSSGIKNSVLDKGLSSSIDISSLLGKTLPFETTIKIKGNQLFSILPFGENNLITINSSWQDPSFSGSFLPDKKQINENGFKATWNVPHLARSYPGIFLKKDFSFTEIANSELSVSLLKVVDSYRNSLRAIKYAILFVTLSFLCYFLFEIVSDIKVHPFQYSLIGVGISLFYLLLLSLSEFIGFNLAYLIASLSIIILITLYTRTISTGSRKSLYLAISGLLSLLYGFLYFLLQMQEISLLIGSLVLLIALATVMYATRKINWYK